MQVRSWVIAIAVAISSDLYSTPRSLSRAGPTASRRQMPQLSANPIFLANRISASEERDTRESPPLRLTAQLRSALDYETRFADDMQDVLTSAIASCGTGVFISSGRLGHDSTGGKSEQTLALLDPLPGSALDKAEAKAWFWDMPTTTA